MIGDVADWLRIFETDLITRANFGQQTCINTRLVRLAVIPTSRNISQLTAEPMRYVEPGLTRLGIEGPGVQRFPCRIDQPQRVDAR